jgi:hypothetical protein
MAKKKVSVRDYQFSDGVLKQKADDVVGSVQRDLTSFSTRGVSATTVTNLQTLITAFDNTQTDEELQGALSVTTDAKNVLADSLKLAIAVVRSMAENKFGVESALFRSFAFDGMSVMSDEQLYRLGKRVIRVATAQLTQLASEGLTAAVITNLTSITTNFDTSIDVQQEAVKNRDIKTQDRVEKGNAVYKEITRLCNTGKSIFVNTDEAKYNDYVIYNTPTGTDETPLVPPVTP